MPPPPAPAAAVNPADPLNVVLQWYVAGVGVGVEQEKGGRYVS